MLSDILATFYERDVLKLIGELRLFRDEANLWKIHGSMKNSAGNLALHIIGGTNYLFGTQLGGTGYVRNRDQEFAIKDVPRAALISQLEALIPLITDVLDTITDKQMDDDYPIMFDGGVQSKRYVLVQLLTHLNYHLGQVNYLRRALE
ncbi:DinB family protein [Chryseolinea sp. T2]|uniref:DinB family protein n=1 Tax=Chryseolinea sp. T2 TaxID=3129255 RepID=UPI003076D6C4